MHALVIVTLTLSGLAGVLFGSDVLDRRLTVRSGGSIPSFEPAGPADEPAAAPPAAEPALEPALARSAARLHASALRPAAPCHHCRSSRSTSVPSLRTPGPLRVPASH